MTILEVITGLLGRIFASILADISDRFAIVVALNPAVTFCEDNQGKWWITQWSAVITVLNHSHNPIKIDHLGFILKNDQRVVITPLIQKLELPVTIDGKDRAHFKLDTKALLHIADYGLDNIKRVYAADRTLNEFKGKIAQVDRNRIMQIVQHIVSEARFPVGKKNASHHVSSTTKRRRRKDNKQQAF